MTRNACVTLFLFVLVANLSAQSETAQGFWTAQGYHHQRESEALKQATEKLLWQIELRVSSTSAFSAILDEQGNFMDFDPYSQSREVFESPVQVLNATQSTAPRATINSPFAITLNYRAPTSFEAYNRGLNQVSALLKEALNHLKTVVSLDEAELSQKAIIAYLEEYQKYRNMAVLHGLTEDYLASVPLLIAELQEDTKKNQYLCDSLERISSKVIGFLRNDFERSGASIFIEAAVSLKATKSTSFSNELKLGLESGLRQAKLKFASSARAARWLLRSNYVVLRDNLGNLNGMDLYFSLVPNTGPEKGMVKQRLIFKVLNQVFDKFDY